MIFEEGARFDGHIVGFHIERVGDEIVARGRLVGELGGERIDRTFENVAVPVLDETGEVIRPNGERASCEVFFLELEPVFFEMLRLGVEVPDPFLIEIRAEPGAGQLLNNLLCRSLGLSDR